MSGYEHRHDVWTWAAVLLCTLSAAPARAQEPPSTAEPDLQRLKACVAQHEQAQVDRNRGDLLSARSALLACSQIECPSIVKSDCSQWFAEVSRDMPSVVVSVRSGADDVEALLYVDGQKQPADVYGRALELNPGRHHFRMEPKDAPPQERDVMLAPRDKTRLIQFEVDRGLPVAAEPAPTPAPLATKRPVPVTSLVLAGAALALAGGGAVLG